MKEESIQDGKINVEAFKSNFLSDAELAMKRLQEHNESQVSRKGAQNFIIQGFMVIGVSEPKARKKLRNIMGRHISNTDVELDQLRDTMIAIKNELMLNKEEDDNEMERVKE